MELNTKKVSIQKTYTVNEKLKILYNEPALLFLQPSTQPVPNL